MLSEANCHMVASSGNESPPRLTPSFVLKKWLAPQKDSVGNVITVIWIGLFVEVSTPFGRQMNLETSGDPIELQREHKFWKKNYNTRFTRVTVLVDFMSFLCHDKSLHRS